MSSSLQVSCSSQQELPVGGTPLEKDLQELQIDVASTVDIQIKVKPCFLIGNIELSSEANSVMSPITTQDTVVLGGIVLR